MPTATILVSVLLAVLGGYVDVVCVIRYKAFPATQTGNVVFVGSSLHQLWYGHTHGKPLAPGEEFVEIEDILYRVLVILSSMLGAYAYCLFEHFQKKQREKSQLLDCSFYPVTASTTAPLLAILVALADIIPWLYTLSGAEDEYEEALEAGKWCCVPINHLSVQHTNATQTCNTGQFAF